MRRRRKGGGACEEAAQEDGCSRFYFSLNVQNPFHQVVFFFFSEP